MNVRDVVRARTRETFSLVSPEIAFRRECIFRILADLGRNHISAWGRVINSSSNRRPAWYNSDRFAGEGLSHIIRIRRWDIVKFA